jgi:hypothetical protein
LLRCSRRMPSRARLECDEVLQGDYFGPEFRRGLIITQRWWPRWSERSNSPGLV